MAKYKIIKPINAGSGFYHDKDDKAIPVQSLAPKVGDVVDGTIETKLFDNKTVTGILYSANTGAKGADGNQLIVIPKDAIELVVSDEKKEVSNGTTKTTDVPKVNASTASADDKIFGIKKTIFWYGVTVLALGLVGAYLGMQYGKKRV